MGDEGDEEARIRPYDPRYTQAKTAFVQPGRLPMSCPSLAWELLLRAPRTV